MAKINKVNINRKYQIISFDITAAFQVVRNSFQTLADYEKLTGVNIQNNDSNNFLGSSFGMTINGAEVFPNNFPAEIINVGQEVSANDRFYSLDLPADKLPIEYNFTDGGNKTYPYKIVLCFVNENPCKDEIEQ